MHKCKVMPVGEKNPIYMLDSEIVSISQKRDF